MRSLRGSEPTALEAAGCEWRYALLVAQARNDDDDDCIESTLGKLSRVLSRIREIFIETLIKYFNDTSLRMWYATYS